MNSPRRLDNVSASILDVIFPPVCTECGRRGCWVCDQCRGDVLPLGEPDCERCGAIAPSGCVCGDLPAGVAAMRSAYPFEGWVRASIHALKYEGERARARFLGELVEPLLRSDGGIDVVVPVPLHPTRLRERSFNQARLIADWAVGGAGDIEVMEISRSGSTRAQVGLSSAERRANVAGGFAVPESSSLAGQRVAILDDVITTASTMAACATAVAATEPASIVCLSVARAV